MSKIITFNSKNIIDNINCKYKSWYSYFISFIVPIYKFEGEHKFVTQVLPTLFHNVKVIVCDFTTKNEHVIYQYYCNNETADYKYMLELSIFKNYNKDYYLIISNNKTSERVLIAKLN